MIMKHPDPNWWLTASVDEICAYTDRIHQEAVLWLPVMEKLVEVNNLLTEIKKEEAIKRG
jgi:hypothetical protein